MGTREESGSRRSKFIRVGVVMHRGVVTCPRDYAAVVVDPRFAKPVGILSILDIAGALSLRGER